MRIALEVIFVTGIFGGFFGRSGGSPVPKHQIVAKEASRNALDEMFHSYVEISKDEANNSNEVDVISRVQEVYLDDPNVEKNGKQQTKTAYLLVKTLRQRNKRYISYLTLCHFKICNMGRKRNARYFDMIRRHDNEA